MTTLSEARQAIYSTFLTAWGMTTPVAFDNEAFTPPEASAWARLHVQHFLSQQETLGPAGGRKFSRQARVVVQIFVPSNKGTQQSDTLAQQARNVFEGRSLAGTTIRFTAVETREIGPDKRWFQVAVDARFEYDETK